MTPPLCDKHTNLLMVPLRASAGRTFVHLCPVPSCGRHHDDEGYFEVVNGRVVREANAEPMPNRIVSAREKIPMTIRTRGGSVNTESIFG